MSNINEGFIYFFPVVLKRWLYCFPSPESPTGGLYKPHTHSCYREMKRRKKVSIQEADGGAKDGSPVGNLYQNPPLGA
jgi:hypothetical protein